MTSISRKSTILWFRPGNFIDVDCHSVGAGSPRCADFYIVTVGQESEPPGSPDAVGSTPYPYDVPLQMPLQMEVARKKQLKKKKNTTSQIYFPWISNVPMIFYWVSWALGLRPLVACAWCNSPWTRRCKSTALGSAVSAVSTARWGQNGSSCTSTLLWLPYLRRLDHLHSGSQWTQLRWNDSSQPFTNMVNLC